VSRKRGPAPPGDFPRAGPRFLDTSGAGAL